MRRDVQFAVRRAARQLLDRAAVGVARREVHRGEVAAVAQAGVDQADAFEQLRPRDVRHQPHAGDDVADRDVRDDLALVRVLDHLVDRHVLRGQAHGEPAEGRRGLRVLVAQALGELRGEDLRQVAGGALGDVGVERAARVSRHEQPVGELFGVVTFATRDRDLLGEPPQVLDEHDAQRDRDGPQLADREGLDGLVRRDEATQHLGIEVTVGVRDERPGDAEDPRIARERTVRELRQLPVEAGRQVQSRVADLLLHEVVVVQQPLGGRHRAAPALEFECAGPVGGEQDGRVVVEPPVQRRHVRRTSAHRLRLGEAARVLLEAFDAEQFLSHGRAIGPRRGACTEASSRAGERDHRQPVGPSSREGACDGTANCIGKTRTVFRGGGQLYGIAMVPAARVCAPADKGLFRTCAFDVRKLPAARARDP